MKQILKVPYKDRIIFVGQPEQAKRYCFYFEGFEDEPVGLFDSPQDALDEAMEWLDFEGGE